MITNFQIRRYDKFILLIVLLQTTGRNNDERYWRIQCKSLLFGPYLVEFQFGQIGNPCECNDSD